MLAAGVPGSPTSAVFALVGVVEPAVSVVSPHPSRVAAAAFHEFCAAAGAAPFPYGHQTAGLRPRLTQISPLRGSPEGKTQPIFLSTSAEFFDPNAMQLQTACSISARLPGSGT